MYTYVNNPINLIKLTLVFLRCLAFILTVPIFGRRDFPPPGKIGLSILLAFIISPIIGDISFDGNLLLLIIYVLKETLVGLTIGYITVVTFSALYLAGQILDMQLGLGIANVLDPQLNTQIPLLGSFYYMLTLTIFVIVNGHHVLISALIKSFEIIPIGKAVFSQNFLTSIIICFKEMFIVGIKISIPILAIILLTDIAFAIIARIVPQMNVFLVGLPIKFILGIIIIILALPTYLIALDVIFNGLYDNIFYVLQGMKQ